MHRIKHILLHKDVFFPQKDLLQEKESE
jgi:hypothetical protein